MPLGGYRLIRMLDGDLNVAADFPNSCLKIQRLNRHHKFILPHFKIKLQTYIMQWQATRKTEVQLAGGL